MSIMHYALIEFLPQGVVGEWCGDVDFLLRDGVDEVDAVRLQ